MKHKNEQIIKAYLEDIKSDLEAKMNDISLDFVSDYDIESDYYISDLFSECADNNISVYCSDQREYFNEHPEECESALLSLYCGEDLADYIKKNGLSGLLEHAGVCGWYETNYNQLGEDEENIKKLFVIRYLLKNNIFNLCKSDIDNLLEEASDYDNDRTSDLLDLINEALANEEESEQ